MNDVIHRRLILIATGAIAGLAFYALTEWLHTAANARLLALCFVATGYFFGSLLILFGRISLWLSLRGAALQAAVTTLLFWSVSLRFEPDDVTQVLQSPTAIFGLLVMGAVPLPFLIVVHTTSWKDYPHLFQEAWSIFVRYAVAWMFAGLAYLLIALSDSLLSTVGVSLIGDLLEHNYVFMPLLGGLLGLGLALVLELDTFISPDLLVRLLRIFSPFILFISLIFLISIIVNGAEGFREFLSPAGILLALVAVSVSIISAVIDRDDSHAAHGRIIAQSARLLAVIVPIMAAIAAWGIVVRVLDLGWTPTRVLAAMLAIWALAYGATYAGSVLRGAAWMRHIRQGNIRLALLGVVLAGLGLTPVINAERMSAQSQFARLSTPGAVIDYHFWDGSLDLGIDGAAAVDDLVELSKKPGYETLAQALTERSGAEEQPPNRDALIANIVALMPLQPSTATATRDILLQGASDADLEQINRGCQRKLPSGKPACVMVVADFLPASVGEEALALYSAFEWRMESRTLIEGEVSDRPLSYDLSTKPDNAWIIELIEALQAEPKPIQPVQLNQMDVNGKNLIILP